MDNIPENALPGDRRLLEGRESEPRPKISALVAEDNDSVRNVLQLRLGGINGRDGLFDYVEVFPSGEEALSRLEKAQEEGNIFNVLWTDLVMGKGISGDELAREATKIDERIVTILVSSHVGNLKPEQEAPFDLSLGKPFTTGELRAFIPQIIKKIREKNRQPEQE